MINRIFRFLRSGKTLENRLSVYFLSTGIVMSTLAFVLGTVFQVPFWMNFPSLIIAIMCISLPIIFEEKTGQYTIVALFIVGVFYFPFLFFTNGGSHGGGPYYFIMITSFFAFYLKGKQLVVLESFFIFYYLTVILFAHFNPSYVVPFDNQISQTMDIIVAVTALSIVMVLISTTTFRSYERERRVADHFVREVKERNNMLESITKIDYLTSLYNKEYFESAVQREIERYELDHMEFQILMVDVDHIHKNIDDENMLYSDDILKIVANSIEASVRPHDVVARYSGKEFAILITNSTTKIGTKMAERIRRRIEINLGDSKEEVVISVGVQNYKEGQTALDVIEDIENKFDKGKGKAQKFYL